MFFSSFAVGITNTGQKGIEMKKMWTLLCLIAIMISLVSCGKNNRKVQTLDSAVEPSGIDSKSQTDISQELEYAHTQAAQAPNMDTKNMKVQVGDEVFSAVLEENKAAAAFEEMLEDGPIVLQMREYSGFEKVGNLGTSLPASNKQTTTKAGDIVLYNGNQIVIFYGSNSWSYTRLGHIADLTGWEEALGKDDVIVSFSLE